MSRKPSSSRRPLRLEILEDRSLPSATPGSIELEFLSRYSTGLGITNAEIVAYDPATHRLFVNNSTAPAASDDIDIVDITNPSAPVKVGGINFAFPGFAGSNGAAFKNGILAVAVEASVKTDPGLVAFYTAGGTFLGQVGVGALPDMLTFTPDGTKLLVANEGEPNSYNQATSVDPEGSVSIIDLSGGVAGATVTTVSFAAYNGQEDALRALGVRIFGPNATAAQDLEPESITTDGRTAWVTLQENNALAIIDLAAAVANPAMYVPTIKPLGLKDHNVASLETFTFDLSGESAGTTAAGQSVPFGGFSGLFFEGYAANGNLRFITHTDRGPNGEPSGQNRPFLVPTFNPTLVRFELNRTTGQLTITQKIGLKDKNGVALTGLPNINRAADPGLTLEQTPNNDEIAVNLTGAPLAAGLDPLGGDFEGVAVDADGTFWMCDEYRPAIYHFDATGKLIDRFIPIGTHAAAGEPYTAGTFGKYGTEALPAVLGQRRQNRGFEALALFNGKVYAFVQSPNRNPSTQGNAALNAQTNVRLVEFDPATRATRQFIYQMDNLPGVGTDSRADKIGDMLSLGNGEFLVVERDDDAIGSDPASAIQKKVYRFSLTGATDVSGITTVAGKTPDQMTAAELTAAGITAVKKTLHVDLNTAGYNTVEKVEGLALVDAFTIAVINDNDFGVAGAAVNPAGTFTPTGVPTILGLISTNNLDASDRDGPGNNPAINIRPWPVLGMYQPDALAHFTAGGNTYLVTANEGDARDYTGFVEEARVGDADYALDPAVFPEADLETNNDKLNRLTVSRATGNTDADPQYEQIHVFGSRSFSIRDAAGNLIWDSGDALEQITALALPDVFNASNDNNSLDNRSDNKGPEPEGITVGVVSGKTYAFVALERIGGVVVFDVSVPTAPTFVQYINTRNFAVSPTGPGAGEVGPEGIIFISAEDSPIGRPLVVTANEISATVGIFQVNEANLVYQAPAGPAANNLVLRQNGANLELLDADVVPAKVLLRQSLAATNSLTIVGQNGEAETLTVDFAFGGAFDLAGGVAFTAGDPLLDTLRFLGTAGNDDQTVGNTGGQFNDLTLSWTGVEKYTLDGAGGDDTYRIATTFASVRVKDAAGLDTLDFSQAFAGVVVDLSRASGQTQVVGGGFNLLAIEGHVENAIGSDHDDVLRGSAGDNHLVGGDGRDRLLGEAGHDLLDGGGGHDVLNGGTGHDVLLGGDGFDILFGGAGHDILIGGLGSDLLSGDAGDDILIGGTTAFDANPAALNALRAEWTSTRPYEQRVKNLIDGSGSAVRANGGFFLNLSTVQSDGALDLLFGGGDRDWFFDFFGDVLLDRKSNEKRNV